MRRFLVICALGLSAIVPERVEAGAFVVKACHLDVGWVNNAWATETSMAATEFAAFQACPPGTVDPYGSVAQGIGISDRLGGADVPSDARFAEWRVSAPAGTRLSAYSMQRDIGNRNHLASGAFTPYARSDDGDLPAEGCYVSSGFYCRQQGASAAALDSAFLAWGIRCVKTAFCGPGADLHHVWVTISSVAVTITDDVAPAVEPADGALASGAWARGNQTVTASASDSTGIRRLALEVDGTAVVSRTAPGPSAGGCGTVNQGVAYSFTAPCAGARGVNGAQAIEVGTAAIANGTHSMRAAALDTASNRALSAARTIRVDNEAPPAPLLVADGEWSAAEEATIGWTVPVESDRAPIVEMEVERCGAGSCVVESRGGADGGTAVSHARPVDDGETSFRVRHRDSAGNWSGWSEPAVVRRDRAAPAVTLRDLPQRVPVGQTVHPQADGSDSLSGVRAVEVEWQANGGEWRAAGGGVRLDAPGVARVRARAVDRAGNTSAWAESSDVAFVSEEPAPVSPPVAAPDSAFGGADGRARVVVRRLRLQRRGQTVRLSGRLIPSDATGRLRATLRLRRDKDTIRRRGSMVVGQTRRFRLTVRAPTGSRALRRVRLRYTGDARHAPRAWNVKVRR